MREKTIDQQKSDTRSFDLAAELERVTNLGYAPNIIYDDNGFFAVTDQCISNSRTKGELFSITSFCEPEWFWPTPQEAWKVYLERLREYGYEHKEAG